MPKVNQIFKIPTENRNKWHLVEGTRAASYLSNALFLHYTFGESGTKGTFTQACPLAPWSFQRPCLIVGVAHGSARSTE